MEGYWEVYVLYSGKKPVYVGCSENLEKRISQHKKDKIFDSYRVFYMSGSKQAALRCERFITDFVIDNYDHLIYNKQKRSFIQNGQLIFINNG